MRDASRFMTPNNEALSIGEPFVDSGKLESAQLILDSLSPTGRLGRNETGAS